MTLYPARRATPFAAVAALHVAAVAALMQAPAVRERIVHAAPLLVEFIAAPRPHAAEPPLVMRPVLRPPMEIRIPPPQVVIETSRPAIALAAREELAPAPPAAITAPQARAVEQSVDAPRFDLAYLRNPAPAYPSLSRRLHEQGRVVLRVRVAASGDPREVRVESSSGSERLDRAAVDAVRHWRFAPARRGSEAIEGEALVPVTFTLEA
jgi:protein TonB